MMRSVLRYGIIIIFFLPVDFLHAQKEANIWYFGNFLGLDFNSGTAVPLNDGNLTTVEGVATISDANGSLLFYTDGVTVWNKIHGVMPNGTGLFGNPTTTQSAIIVPVIGDATRYYIFTVDYLNGPRGLRYSVANITLDGGKGDIEVKNVPLQTGVTEKITAVRHCNNRDVWVVTHGAVSDIYYSFLVSPSGISTTPVVSNSGSVLWGIVAPGAYDSTTMGYLKASPDGKRIAAAHWSMNADVSDFNNATGVVSNSYSLFQPSDPRLLVYGIEFSPDSRLVYTTVFYTNPANAQKVNALYQYDVTLAIPAAVKASKQVISQNSDPIETYAALQVAPDGKMYMAKFSYKHIAAVNNPNVYGPGCNFVSNAVAWTLNAQSCTFGLPTFIQSYFYPPDSFTYTVNCPGLNVNFNYNPPTSVLSVLWKFGDPVSGANNTSAVNNPVHVFSTPGNYNVELIRFTNCGPDTLRKVVSTHDLSIQLGLDTTVCGSTSIVLNPSAVGSTNTFQWQDGSTNPTYVATANGLYWVQATNSMGCTFRDSIQVLFKSTPVFDLGRDSNICDKDTLALNASGANATSYLWNTGATSSSIKAFQAGVYWCEARSGACNFRDSLTIISVNPSPVVNLGNDQSLCSGNPVLLDVTNINSTYLWQDGSTNATNTATTTGLYWVNVINNFGCNKRDSVIITFTPVPAFNLGSDTSICQNDLLTLNAGVANATGYSWSTGATTSSINVSQTGLYWCEAVKNGCVFRDSLSIISLKPYPVVNLGNDQTVCEGVTVNLDATYPNSNYLWQDGNTNPAYAVTQQGIYSVQVNLNGCKKIDTVVVNFNLKPRFTLGPDQPICPGMTITLNPVLNPAWQLSWQDGSTGPTYIVTNPASYSLTATNNCGSTIEQVLVSKGICKVFVPSGFTPNNDGKNDVFKALGSETVTQLQMKIFNRWGEIVFESKDKYKGWDGKYKGKMQSNGVFVYILEYKDANSPEKITLKGTITLIH